MVNKKILPILFILWIGYSSGVAQVCLPVSGGDYSSSYGSVSFTLGQLFYTTDHSSTGNISKGIQQAYDIIPIYTNNMEKVEINISVYPNPVSHQLIVEIEDEDDDVSSFYFRLYDLQGKILQNGEFEKERIQIMFDDYVSSVYYLCITKGTQLVNTFKIIKK